MLQKIQQTSRVLVVGINPSTAKKGWSTTWSRLPKWADYLGLDVFSFTNCIHSQGKYSLKSVDYDMLRECARGYKRVVALGNFPSAALSRCGIDHFTLPHPSGLNRKLNDKLYELEQLDLCRKYIHG